MRTRSRVALVAIGLVLVLAGCGGGGGGGGGGGPEHVERGVWYPIQFDPPCPDSELPVVVFDSSQWTIALVRDHNGRILKPADLATDATGQVRLLSVNLAEYQGQTGLALTATLHRQEGSPAPCA